MSSPFLPKLIASLSIFACTSAFAVVTPVPLQDVDSVGVFGDPGNTVVTRPFAANALVTSISFDVDLTAYAGSTLDDISVAISNTNLDGVIFSPAAGNVDSSNGHFQGLIDLTLIDGVFNVGADGLLRFEFFENIDNVAGADGRWDSGSFSIVYSLPDVPGVPAGVPEPATGALMAAGLGIMAYAGRRRNASPASRTSPTLH